MLKPFIKWPGGKSEELPIIHSYLPQTIHNYIEPFLGGGACFLSLDDIKYNKAYVNDLSNELIDLYICIRDKNPEFYSYLNDIWSYWGYIGTFAIENMNEIKMIYEDFKANNVDQKGMKNKVNDIFKSKQGFLYSRLPKSLDLDRKRLINMLKVSLISKLNKTMKKERKDGDLPEEDYNCNFESGIRAGVYTFYRYLYNNNLKYNIKKELRIALFFYIREFCYSSMFRYNKKGEFNVPYGGLSYNNKHFISKIEYTTDSKLLSYIKKAEFFSLDFETFLNNIPITQNDFMFLDPPYDGGFSTYAKNEFLQKDQIRLANFLMNECQANFMLIIKNTDFIADLYEGHDNINILGFGKDYRVSFMDRNDKKVEHLLITNYKTTFNIRKEKR